MANSQGTPYAENRLQQGVRVGHVFTTQDPGRPKADSLAVAIETADGASYIVTRTPNSQTEIQVADVRHSQLQGRSGGFKRNIRSGENPFPAIGDPVRGSAVTKIQTVEA